LKVAEITIGEITRLRYEDIQTVEMGPRPKTRNCHTRKDARHVKF
jgi:hypothetical protein